MKVKNLNGTSVIRCKCTSWLAHWLRYSGQKASKCSVLGCTNRELVGGHVQMDSPGDTAWYVIPVCKSCSQKTGQALNISDQVPLVSAIPSHTCG